MSAVPKQVLSLAPMSIASLESIHAIERQLYEFPWTIGNFRDSIDAGYHCLEYRGGSNLIGYAVVMIAIDEAHLLNLTIAPAFQRHGHGTRLLHALFDLSRHAGAHAMILEVRPSNTSGRALYVKLAFEQIGVRRDYYPAVRGREDALVLRRTL